MTRAVTILPLVAALVIYSQLLNRLRRVDGPEPPWWFGYARDGANLAAAFMFWGSYCLHGFATATALLAALLTTLVIYILDWTLGRALGLKSWFVIAVPLGIWAVVVAWMPGGVSAVFERLIHAAS
jgi:hypothetical protein